MGPGFVDALEAVGAEEIALRLYEV